MDESPGVPCEVGPIEPGSGVVMLGVVGTRLGIIVGGEGWTPMPCGLWEENVDKTVGWEVESFANEKLAGFENEKVAAPPNALFDVFVFLAGAGGAASGLSGVPANGLLDSCGGCDLGGAGDAVV